jgi:hypothetical protein
VSFSVHFLFQLFVFLYSTTSSWLVTMLHLYHMFFLVGIILYFSSDMDIYLTMYFTYSFEQDFLLRNFLSFYFSDENFYLFTLFSVFLFVYFCLLSSFILTLFAYLYNSLYISFFFFFFKDSFSIFFYLTFVLCVCLFPPYKLALSFLKSIFPFWLSFFSFFLPFYLSSSTI